MSRQPPGQTTTETVVWPLPSGVQACVSWVEDAAQVLRQAELGARPGLAVAVTAVADARAVLRELAA